MRLKSLESELEKISPSSTSWSPCSWCCCSLCRRHSASQHCCSSVSCTPPSRCDTTARSVSRISRSAVETASPHRQQRRNSVIRLKAHGRQAWVGQQGGVTASRSLLDLHTSHLSHAHWSSSSPLVPTITLSRSAQPRNVYMQLKGKTLSHSKINY